MEKEIVRPQEKSFVRAKTVNLWMTRITIAAIMFSIANFFISDIFDSSLWNTISTAMAIIFICATLVTKFFFSYFLNCAETERRTALIDNSFDSKLASKRSERYYDTDGMSSGIARLFANVHESCLFTKRIAGKIMHKRIPIYIAASIALITLGTIGFCNIKIWEPLLEFLLFYLLFDDAYTVLLLSLKTGHIEESARVIWDTYDRNRNSTGFIANSFLLIIRYECALTRACTILDEKVYRQLRSEVENDWFQLRNRYNI